MPLYTKRLLLRKMQVGDAPGMFDLNNDPLVVQYTGDGPFTNMAAAEEFIRRYDAYDKWGYGRLNCFLKESGEYIGWCGLKYHLDEDETDLGYRLKQKFWNQGYATEASRICLQYGFEALALPFIVGRVMKRNTASIKVLQKLGMRFWKEHNFHEHAGLYYKITREDYQRQVQSVS